MKINKAKPQRRFETVVGSGVIIDRDGQVLTNAHVVDGAASLSVTLDSKEKVPARVLGLDPVLDLALLRLETSSTLTTARLGDSSTLKVGEEVVAIGNPIGLDQTMTRGIVSALNRILPGISDQPLIQTDAPINPGNSGGPLFDRCGNVIGINTFISEDAQSIGFAVPVNAAKAVLKDLREQGRVVRPWLGIQGREVDNRVGCSDPPSRRPGLPGRGRLRWQSRRPCRHPRRQPVRRHPGRRIPSGRGHPHVDPGNAHPDSQRVRRQGPDTTSGPAGESHRCSATVSRANSPSPWPSARACLRIWWIDCTSGGATAAPPDGPPARPHARFGLRVAAAKPPLEHFSVRGFGSRGLTPARRSPLGVRADSFRPCESGVPAGGGRLRRPGGAWGGSAFP